MNYFRYNVYIFHQLMKMVIILAGYPWPYNAGREIFKLDISECIDIQLHSGVFTTHGVTWEEM